MPPKQPPRTAALPNPPLRKMSNPDKHNSNVLRGSPDRSPARDRAAGDSTAVAGASRLRAPLWATLTATFFGVGHLNPRAGTWASVATVLLWAALAYELPP